MKWFKHDANASRDSKLRRVKMKYGMSGYGLYWHCLEVIVDRVDANNVTFELEDDSEIISLDTGISRELVEEMMGYMVELGLFESSNGTITCLKLAKRLDQSMTSNPKMRKLIKDVCGNHDGNMTESDKNHDGNMIGSAQNRTEEKRKEKKTLGRFSPPSESEVQNQIQEKGYSHVTAEEFCSFYGSKNWMVGKNKMTDWRLALGGWEARRSKEVDVGHGSGRELID